MMPRAGTMGCYSARYSLLLDATSSQYLSRSPSVAGNRQRWTASFWIKGGVSRPTTDTFFHAYDTAAPLYRNFVRTTNGNLEVYVGNGSVVGLTSVAQLRDEAAHYHIHVAVDTTQAIAADRVRVWVNNERLLSFTGGNYPAQNELTQINGPWAHHIGTTGGTYFRDGLISECNFIDGLALEPSAFCYYCPLTGQWQPKKYTGSYGTNGFRLEFQNAAALGYDSSGAGNHWTPNGGIVAANQTIDTPTNNHCTLNPLVPGAANIIQGNLKQSSTTASWGTFDAAAMNSYWEISAGASNVTAGTITPAGATHTTTVTAGKTFAFELAAGVGVLRYRNVTDAGAWTDIATGLSGTRFPYGAGAPFTINCGQRAFAGVPGTGYLALCTRYLPRPAQRPKNVFAAVAAAGLSVEAALAAVRPWANYIEIFKHRSNLQSWQWRFSDDLANMLSSNSTAGKAVFVPPTAADNYVGYALRVGAGYGVVTTEVAHVNGTPTTVAHGLGTNRIMAVGKIVNIAGDWYVWHPELAANQYLLLNSTAAAAAGPKITVDAASVILDASLPSGTYRIIAMAETSSGCVKLGKYTGNGAADGPFFYAGARPAAVLVKRTELAGNNWLVLDERRAGYNVTDSTLEMDTANAETLLSTNALDLVSNGAKIRGAGAGVNASGGTYIYVALAEAPLKYANAR
jgi:hypothetical protein